MRKEIKDILVALAIVLPMCALILVWWFNSPMYAEVQAQQRLAAQSLLRQIYYFGEYGPVEIDQQELMEKYGLTEEDIKPDGILGELDETEAITTPQPTNPIYTSAGVISFLGVLSLIIIYDLTWRRKAKRES